MDYHTAVSDTLRRIEEAVEASGADIDFELAGDILTLEFANGSKIILNKQAAAQQLWLAARGGGFHYNHEAGSGRWVNDQSGAELWAELARLMSEQAGETVNLAGQSSG